MLCKTPLVKQIDVESHKGELRQKGTMVELLFNLPLTARSAMRAEQLAQGFIELDVENLPGW